MNIGFMLSVALFSSLLFLSLSLLIFGVCDYNFFVFASDDCTLLPLLSPLVCC